MPPSYICHITSSTSKSLHNVYWFNVLQVSVKDTCDEAWQPPIVAQVLFSLSLQIHNGPPHPSNFGYAYAKRLIDIQNRYVAYSHVRATVDLALLRTVWNISVCVVASTCTLSTGTLFLCFPIMLIWSEANPTVKLIHIQCCMDGFSNATKRPTSGGQGTIKRQLYSEPFTLWEAASCIFQH